MDLASIVTKHILEAKFEDLSPSVVEATKAVILDQFAVAIAGSAAEGCLQRTFKGLPISCIYNPSVGYEKELGMGTIRVGKKAKVIVAGGGPGGMEAARVAALRGRKVILYEKTGQLGGQVNLIAKLPGRKDFAEVSRYLSHQIEKLGGEIRLNREATLGEIEKESPDAVILATGSSADKTGFVPIRPDLEKLPGVDQDYVLTVRDVLNESSPLGQNIVMIDWLSDLQATGTAEFLLEQGKKVEIITYLPYVGVELIPPTSGPLFQKLFSKGAVLTPYRSKGDIRSQPDRLPYLLPAGKKN